MSTTTDIETPRTNTPAASAGLTYIALVANFTDKTLLFENLQNGNDETVKPKSLSRLNDMWLPWCENDYDYTTKNHKIAISAAGTGIYWIWESSNKIYYNRDNKFSSGKVLDGDSNNDGYYKAIAVQQAANGAYEMYIVTVKHT